MDAPESRALQEVARVNRALEDHEARLRPLEKTVTETNVTVKNIETDVIEIKSDAKAARATIRSALITAAASIGVQVVLFFVLRGSGT
jgi:septal ring factor EnvC (AmiA/AmiB activator)